MTPEIYFRPITIAAGGGMGLSAPTTATATYWG